MAQFLRPASDISAGLWTTAPLWSLLDETVASDADLATSASNPASDTFEVKLSSGSAPDTGTRTVRYRLGKSATAGRQIDFTVSLLQGTTTLHTWTHTNVDVLAALSQTVTASITDYTDVRLRFVANGVGGGAGRNGVVSWAEFEAPNAFAATPIVGSDTPSVALTETGSLVVALTGSDNAALSLAAGVTDGYFTKLGSGTFVGIPRVDAATWTTPAGDMEIRTDFAPDIWMDTSERTIVAAYEDFEYYLRPNTGTFAYRRKTTAGIVLSYLATPNIGVANGARTHVRAVFLLNNGSSQSQVSFYYRTDTTLALSDNTGWTAAGVVTNANITNTQNLGRPGVGGNSFSHNGRSGDYYRAIAYDSTPALYADFDCRDDANQNTPGNAAVWNDLAGRGDWTMVGTEVTDWTYTADTASGQEGAAISALLARADAAGLSLTETAALLAALSRSDTPSLSMSEAVVLLAVLGRADDATLSVADLLAIAVILAGTDTMSASLTEVAALVVMLAGADNVTLSVAEVAAIAAVLNRADSPSIALADVSAVAVLVAASDSPTLSLTEAVALLVALARTDSMTLSLTEAVALLVALARSDALTVSIADIVTILAAVAATDTPSVSLVEAVAIAAVLAGSDTLGTLLTETAALAVILESADALTVSTTEAVALIAALARADVLSVSAAEAAATLAALTAADTISALIGDAAAIAATITAADPVVIATTDAATVVAALERADTLDLSVTETAALLVQFSAADSLAATLTEAAAIEAALARADSLGISLAEIAEVIDQVILVSASDSLTVSVSEMVALAVVLLSSDTLDLSVADATSVDAMLERADALVTALDEAAAIMARLDRTDLITLGLSDTSFAALLVASADALELLISEAATVTAALALPAWDRDTGTVALSTADLRMVALVTQSVAGIALNTRDERTITLTAS